jgi:hypothetical protein
VTNGWVAVSDGRRGLLLGQDASVLASMAFCAMRLRERNGRQVISLNPFGSYYGRMMDYRHLGGNGIGACLLTAFSGALKPNGPSYNGRRLRFSLMIAPYEGDQPPAGLQAEAGLHFYPPEVVIHRSPPGVAADVADDIRHIWEAEERSQRIAAQTVIQPPMAFVCNPLPGGVVLVWDEPRHGLITGYEAAWRPAGEGEWCTMRIGTETRLPIEGLQDGQPYLFKVRALCETSNGEIRYSAWTEEQKGIPGAVQSHSLLAGIRRLPIGAFVRLVAASLWAVVKAR